MGSRNASAGLRVCRATYGLKLVEAVAVGELDGRPIAISGGTDETVRVWDFGSWKPCAINVGSLVQSLALRSRTTVIGTNAGVMAIQIGVATRTQ